MNQIQTKNNSDTENNDADMINNPSDESFVFEERGTFCKVGSNASGILEVDLQIIKQKGIEIRNVSFIIPLGFDDDGNVVKAEMLFWDEENFEKFKAFIAKLKWND